MILPKVEKEIKGKEQEFCSKCVCKYENRNTAIIKVFSNKKITIFYFANLASKLSIYSFVNRLTALIMNKQYSK